MSSLEPPSLHWVRSPVVPGHVRKNKVSGVRTECVRFQVPQIFVFHNTNTFYLPPPLNPSIYPLQYNRSNFRRRDILTVSLSHTPHHITHTQSSLTHTLSLPRSFGFFRNLTPDLVTSSTWQDDYSVYVYNRSRPSPTPPSVCETSLSPRSFKGDPTMIVYYESMKWNLKIKPIYECRCDGRL